MGTAPHEPRAAQPGRLHPVRVIVVGVATTLVLFGILGWHAWTTYRTLMRIADSELRLQQLGGTIVHLDEVLTMSARMAASTGDGQWEQRYRRYEPQLRAAIDETIRLAPEAAEGEGAAQTERANVELLRMEADAFQLVREGRRDAALALLLSEAYRRQKHRYAAGIDDSLDAVRRRIHDQVTTHRRRLVAAGLAAVAGMVVLFLGWFAIISSVRRHLRERHEAEKENRRLKDELEERVQARTRALQRSEARWRSLVENVPGSIMLVDRDGRISFVSRVLSARMTPEQVVGNRVYDYLSAEQHGAVREAFDRVFTRGETATYEASAAGAGAGTARYLSYLAPIHHGGSIRAAVLIVTDVTEERRVQERIVDQGRLLRSILDSMAEGVMVADREGRFILWNAAAERIMGSGPTDVSPDAWPAHYGIYLPDGVTRYPAEALPLARAVRGEHVDKAEGVVRPGGRPEGTFVTANGHPLRNEAGEFQGGLIVFRDVTVERQAEQARRESERRFRQLFEESPLGMALVDLDARFLEVNDRLCLLTGYGEQELVGHDIRRVVATRAEPAREAEIAARVLRGEMRFLETELQLARKDGAVRSVTLTASVIRNEAGQPLYGIVAIQDVTERKRAEEAAQQRQAELARVLRLTTAGEMASGLAHELNQPLCAIANFAMGCVRRLDDGTLDEAGLRFSIERIATESLRAGQIIHHLLDFVRKGEPSRERAELNRIVRDAAQLADAEARQQRISVRLNLTPDLPQVRIDAIQIEQVILNLVRNAIDAMVDTNGPREVWLSTAVIDADMVEVAVRDSGHGIPPEVEGRLFEPFFTTKTAGLGMGLSITFSIIEAHGGRVWASPNPGAGSTFRFTLPRDAEVYDAYEA